MQSTYEIKKAARIERLERQIAKLRRFAETHDLSLFGEEKSGIPLGQPILVGHHSERRHRRHLERINRLVQKGYDAGKRADLLESRLQNLRSNFIIQVDNPNAQNLLADKLKAMEALKVTMKRVNAEYKKNGGNLAAIDMPEKLRTAAQSTLTHQAYYGKPFPPYTFSNLGASIRRVRGQLDAAAVVQQGFEPFTINQIAVEFVDGQIQLAFPWKPCEETRNWLKRELAFKWSRYSGRWVRKHTATTCTEYFRLRLTAALTAARPCS